MTKTKCCRLVLLLCYLSLSIICPAQQFKGTYLSSDYLPYGNPPYKFKGSQLISITFETSSEVLKALVPKPLVPNSENQISVTVGLQKVISPGEVVYHEAYLSIPVSYGKQRGVYIPILYLDKAIPIIAGREIWGYPKVDADIRFIKENGKVQATVVSNGIKIIDTALPLGIPMGPITGLPSYPVFNLKLIPSVKKNSPPDVKQLTSSIVKGIVVHKVFVGEAKLDFGSTTDNPLKSIPILKLVRCDYSESDFTLDYGDVVYNYLNESK